MLEFLKNLYSTPFNILASIVGWLGIFWLIIVRKRLRMHWLVTVLLSSIFVVYAVYAVQVFSLIERRFNGGMGSMSLYGIPLFVPLLLFLGALITRRPMAEVFDIFSINTVLVCMGGRTNCLFSGCCKGALIPGTEYRYPTREIELLFYLVFLIIMIPRVYKKKTNGTAFPTYMAGYGILRFVLEFFRDSELTTTFHLAHLWSVLCAGIGIGFLLFLRKRAKKTAENTKA